MRFPQEFDKAYVNNGVLGISGKRALLKTQYTWFETVCGKSLMRCKSYAGRTQERKSRRCISLSFRHPINLSASMYIFVKVFGIALVLQGFSCEVEFSSCVYTNSRCALML